MFNLFFDCIINDTDLLIKWVKQSIMKMIQLLESQEIRFDRSVTQWKPVAKHQHYWNKKPLLNVN
jgi:hypothetical protein